MAGDAKGNLFSFFGGKKRIPKDSYETYLKVAMFVDLAFCWMPLAGTVFIGYCRGLWWLNGYKTDKMLATTLVNAAVEMFPGLSFFPSCTAFIWFSYRINKAGTEPLEGEEGATSRAERAQDVAFRAMRRKSAREQSAQEKEPEETASGAQEPGKGKEGREPSPAKESPQGSSPLRDTPKETPRQNKSVDGTVPPSRNAPEKKPAYTPRQPVFKQQRASEGEPSEAVETGEPLPQNDNGEEYFDNAKRVA